MNVPLILDWFTMLLPAGLTLVASGLLLRGNIGLSAEAIAELSSTVLAYNPASVNALARQHANTKVALAVLLGAFFLQVFTLRHDTARLGNPPSPWRMVEAWVAFAAVIAVSGVACCILDRVSQKMSEREVQRVRDLLKG